MKKRKNIIISAITCMVSICLMMFGVYAASNPSVSISGQVSYSARDAKVLVLGKVNGQAGEDQENKIEYPSVADVQNPQENEKVVSATQYMGFTYGTSANDNTDNLAPWTMNSTHSFYEDSTGIRKIIVSFLIRNLSNYPIVATVDFTGVSQTDLAGKNLTRTTTGLTDDNKVYFGKDVVKEISVSYNVANDSLDVTGNNLLDMKISFEKTVFPTPANTKAEHGDTMQSDWEYIFEGDGFAVTKFVGNLPQKDENGKINIIVPSSLVCTDGKSYPVKSLGYPDYAFASLFPEGTDFQEVLKSANFFANVDFTEEGDEDENGNVVTENVYANGSINVTIPEGIKTLNNLVFAGLVLGAVSIPTTLGDCSRTSPLEFPFLIGHILEVKFAQGMKRIGSYLFAWSYLGKVTIPASVEEIGSDAFNSTDIEELLIEENSNLKVLENSAFGAGDGGYETPESFVVPDGVEMIGDNAFYNRLALQKITLPKNLKSIGKHAFASCNALTTVIVNATIPPKAFSDMFQYVTNNFTIYVPTESVEAYKTAEGWKEYADRIQAQE